MDTKVVFYIGRFSGDDEEEQNSNDLQNNICISSKYIKTYEAPKKIITKENIQNKYEQYIDFIINVFW